MSPGKRQLDWQKYCENIATVKQFYRRISAQMEKTSTSCKDSAEKCVNTRIDGKDPVSNKD